MGIMFYDETEREVEKLNYMLLFYYQPSPVSVYH
jgi:hypothetical protein